MVRIITVDDVKNLIRKVTLDTFYARLLEKLETHFNLWKTYDKVSRVVTSLDNGVIELMPFWDKNYYSFKYVNGHPHNPQQNKQTIVGIGMLADIATGYPVCISEMTLLTALRTSATSALAMRYLARKNAKTLAIIGTGAQSEFQVLAQKIALNIEKVRYFDLDPQAMKKFERNLSRYPLQLHACQDVLSAIEGADLITTTTATKTRSHILKDAWIRPGVTINAVGGDCHGKTELDPRILARSKVVVEYLPQSQEEGEIQNDEATQVYAELWELTSQQKPGRVSDDDIFIYDSVGFALEDYVILRLVYSLAEDFHVGHLLDMVPEHRDPKNLFGLLVN
ncbi:MAG: ornithine cyclodeaminase [Gammaproteobacteria bacterium RIFCSPHIGHO2_12_FULL_41_15]|nr:MAG: ornithine cyclodeaminase [Gammaproteobacteria bacterium RIFCSPHIGHO2_12_FULL_41_15]